MFCLEAPGEKAARVAGVAVEEAAMIVGDLAQLAVGDQLPGVLDYGRPAIVVADAGDNAGLLGRLSR